MENEKPKRIVWYAGSLDFIRRGPFSSEVEAWKSLRMTEVGQKTLGRVHVEGAYVWPEEEET